MQQQSSNMMDKFCQKRFCQTVKTQEWKITLHCLAWGHGAADVNWGMNGQKNEYFDNLLNSTNKYCEEEAQSDLEVYFHITGAEVTAAVKQLCSSNAAVAGESPPGVPWGFGCFGVVVACCEGPNKEEHTPHFNWECQYCWRGESISFNKNNVVSILVVEYWIRFITLQGWCWGLGSWQNQSACAAFTWEVIEIKFKMRIYFSITSFLTFTFDMLSLCLFYTLPNVFYGNIESRWLTEP